MTAAKHAPAEHAPSMSLGDIQTSLQRAMLDGDDAILDLICDNSRTSRRTLFGVYRNAYAGRLVDVLGNEYPLLRKYMGDADFETLARRFIAAHPSRAQNARWFGAKLPTFLLAEAAQLEIIELAAIEKAVSDAFDAIDAPVIGVSDLVQFPPDVWGQLRFGLHPSVEVLDLVSNALAIWTALKDDEASPEVLDVPVARCVVVWRQDTTPRVREIGAEERMMWIEAGRGARFDTLCEMTATFDDPDTAATRAAGYLQGWLLSEMLTSVSVV